MIPWYFHNQSVLAKCRLECVIHLDRSFLTCLLVLISTPNRAQDIHDDQISSCVLYKPLLFIGLRFTWFQIFVFSHAIVSQISYSIYHVSVYRMSAKALSTLARLRVGLTHVNASRAFTDALTDVMLCCYYIFSFWPFLCWQ